MCGRFTLRADPKSVAEHFELGEPPELSPRYNIAPGQEVLTVRSDGVRRVGEWRVWGLVPSWAKTPSTGHRMINARSETVAGKPAFASAFRRQRCLVPADGFYEWIAGAGPAQPVYITPAGGGLFAFAGLWESWRGGPGEAVESCTIVTTAADERLRAVHHRMPVILPAESYGAWLDPGVRDPGPLRGLLARGAAPAFRVETVGTRVNDVRHDDPDCAAPAPPQPRQGTLL